VFSLHFNTQYTFQEGSLTNLSISLSENNFLGNRDLFAAAVLMDQGAIAVGPLFIDKNLFGTHVDFRVRVDEILTRQALDLVDSQGTHHATTDPRGIEDGGGLRGEGTDSTVSATLPLWSLASRWGGGVAFSHRYAISRSFFGTGLRSLAVRTDASLPPTLLPQEYELHQWSATANVVRQWGTRLKQQLAFGHVVTSQRPSLLANFPDDPVLRDAFTRAVLPRSELVSTPFIEYAFFEPRYQTVRNINTYELAEDLRLGPDLDVTIAQGLRTLGSDAHFTRPTLSVGWTFPWCRDGFVRPSASASLRIQDATLASGPVSTIDNSATAQLRFATPSSRYLRLIAQINAGTRWHDTQNAFYSIGSDGGLRGYNINQFIGQRRASGQFELRSLPKPWWVLRVGAVAFYEVGGAANSFATMALYHDVGIGIRALIPQTSRELFRFDLAFPLQAAPGNGRAFTPHPVLSFDSAF
jgi:hypothetical protein